MRRYISIQLHASFEFFEWLSGFLLHICCYKDKKQLLRDGRLLGIEFLILGLAAIWYSGLIQLRNSATQHWGCLTISLSFAFSYLDTIMLAILDRGVH
jgi:hypothetical protein